MATSTRPAQRSDAAAMRSVDAAAGSRFAAVDDPRIAACADDEPLTEQELTVWIDAGRAWVAIEAGEVTGFVVADVVDGNAHVEELAVRPDCEGRGHGGTLLDLVTEWAAAGAMTAVTLTTFSDVAWNRPFYERRGFRVLDTVEIGPDLAGRVVTEESHGLPAALRVCMSRGV